MPQSRRTLPVQALAEDTFGTMLDYTANGDVVQAACALWDTIEGMRFGILGAVEMWDEHGVSLPIGGPRVRTLLALLLLNPGKILPAELLIDGLYGEEPPGNAANALQSQMSRLRRALAGIAEVESSHGGYRLAADPLQVDAHRFLRLVRDAGAQAPAAAVALLDEALALWRGPALADVPRAQGHAVRFEEARVTALEDRAAAGLALGRHRDLVASLRDLVAEHPLRERPRALLMRALYGSGRQGEALELYEQTRRMLADELGTDPSPGLAEAYLAILRGEPEPVAPPVPTAFPEPVSGSASAPAFGPMPVRPRLPAQITSFVGREEDLTRIAAMLENARLITLTGPGGVGKTRLAIEAGMRADGCFADFAAVAAGEGQAVLVRVVLSALGLREAGVLPGGEQVDPVERLEAALRDRRTLLILDNCEHVIASAAALSRRLLAACPGLRILATGREALGIIGEALWPVRQLGLPDPSARLAEAAAAPAVRLFTDRAAATRPGFTLTADNLEDVITICAALDGQPLAIELAAARLRTLTVAEVVDRLGDRFRLLSRGDRTQSPRHRTLRAVVEWSWDLLEPAERRLARRLSVFAGEFTADAAEQVCGGDEDLLLDLADRSLLQRTPLGRYRMLQTIKAYCAERLQEAGEEHEVRRAHAESYLRLARTADAQLRSADQVIWLDRLDEDRENLHAALRWALDADSALALRLVGVLSSYWWLRGIRGEGADAGSRLLAEHGEAFAADPAGSQTPGEGFEKGFEEEYVLVVALVALGGEHVPALPALIKRAERALNMIDRPLRQPYLQAMWALAAEPPGDREENLNRIMVQRSAQFAGDPWVQALVLLGRAYMRMGSGRPDLGRPYLDRALAGFEALGERWGMTQTLDALATVAERNGDLPRALELLDEALRLVRELCSQADTAEILGRRGDVLIGLGRYDDARVSLRSARELAERTGAQGPLAAVHQSLGDLALRQGDLDGATTCYEHALAQCPPRWYHAEVRTRSLLGLAEVARARGDDETARTHTGQALTAARENLLDHMLVERAEALLHSLSDPA